MNKKGQTTISHLNWAPLVFALIIGIIFLTFYTGGGAKTIFNLGAFVSKVPTWLWAVFGIMVVWKVVRGRK